MGPTRNAKKQATYRQRQKANGKPGSKGPASASGKHRIKFNAPFIGWDGEGKTLEDGSHIYTLLANSTGRYIENIDGLSTSDCFDFIFEEVKKLGWYYNHVCFGAGYDVNMILGDLPEAILRELNSDENINRVGDKNQTRIHGVSFNFGRNDYSGKYRPRKCFWIARRNREGTNSSFTLYDVQSFFQTRFTTALTDYCGSNLDKKVLEEIALMKERRGNFAEEDPIRIREYCLNECSYLVTLMDTLRDYMRKADIKVQAWDGSGSIARDVMTRAKVKDHIVTIQNEELKDAVKRGYTGGRIEICKIGHGTGIHYDHDINSAYPSVLRGLPCLVHSSWKYGPKAASRIYLSRVSFSWTDSRIPFFPFFVRDSFGNVRYSNESEAGWYWNYEFEAALEFCKVFKPQRFKVLGVWSLIETCDCKPFAFIDGLYEKRKLLKANKEPAERVLKLAINSIYGKLCQQLGGSETHLPPFFALEWAGLTTSGTRAKLLLAALHSPDSVVHFATDGLLTSEKLPLDFGKEMGQWDLKRECEEVVIVQPGVYFLRTGETWFYATRGLEKETVADGPKFILNAWSEGKRIQEYTSERFVTMRSALVGKSISSNWRRWIKTNRVFDITGDSSKRWGYAGELRNLVDGLSPLQVKNAFVGESYPFKVDFWKDKEVRQQQLEDEDETEQYEST